MRTPLNLQNIDFDSLKQSLKDFMSSQDKFIDIDFEGSNINVLLDLLASNGQLYLFYQHMGLNEAFIDSALLRSSIISKAKELGYLPGSAKAASARVNLSLSNVANTPNGIYIPYGARFTGKGSDGKTYTFVTLKDYTAVKSAVSTVYTCNNIDIFEGRLYTFEFTVDMSKKTFVIPNKDIDISSLIVTVKTSSTINYTEEYFRADTLLDVTTETNAYFLQQGSSGEYEIYFGDGIISKKLESGNIVRINYLVTNKELGNGIGGFDFIESVYPNIVPAVTVQYSSFGGADEESTEDIRINAKKSYTSQYRSVTPYDYIIHIKQDYPNVRSVHVWGGEDNDPPQLGKVFCSLATDDLTPLSNEAKNSVISVIKKRNVIGIKPVIVDPEIITVFLDGYVRTNRHLTTVDPQTLKNSIISQISYYNDAYLKKFGSNFQFSTLVKLIESIDPSFEGTVMDIFMELEKRYLGVAATYTFNFRTGIREKTLTSNKMKLLDQSATIEWTLTDKEGSIYGYYLNEDNQVQYTTKPYGTVNYTTGLVTLSNINPTIVDGTTSIRVAAQPKRNEVISSFNQVINIDINRCSATITSLS